MSTIAPNQTVKYGKKYTIYPTKTTYNLEKDNDINISNKTIIVLINHSNYIKNAYDLYNHYNSDNMDNTYHIKVPICCAIDVEMILDKTFKNVFRRYLDICNISDDTKLQNIILSLYKLLITLANKEEEDLTSLNRMMILENMLLLNILNIIPFNIDNETGLFYCKQFVNNQNQLVLTVDASKNNIDIQWYKDAMRLCKTNDIIDIDEAYMVYMSKANKSTKNTVICDKKAGVAFIIEKI